MTILMRTCSAGRSCFSSHSWKRPFHGPHGRSVLLSRMNIHVCIKTSVLFSFCLEPVLFQVWSPWKTLLETKYLQVYTASTAAGYHEDIDVNKFSKILHGCVVKGYLCAQKDTSCKDKELTSEEIRDWFYTCLYTVSCIRRRKARIKPHASCNVQCMLPCQKEEDQ